MENLDHLAQSSGSLLMSLALAVLGFILYWGIMLSKKKKERGASFDWCFWWGNNWLGILLSLIACSAVFIGSYAGNSLTLERSVMIGALGAFLVERLQKMIE